MKEVTEADLVSKESWESSHSSIREQSETTPRKTLWSESLLTASGQSDRGCVLLLCGSRAKQLHRCSRRAVLQVLETSHLFELYAHDMTKALSTLGSVAVGIPQIHSATTSSSSTLSTSEASRAEFTNGGHPLTMIALQQLTTASVAHYLGIAKSIKNLAADPLERFLSTYDDAIRLACERHVTSRRRAEKARQKALTAHSVYTSVHEEVRMALVDWYKEYGDNHDVPPFSGKLASKIAQLKSCEARYKRLVLEENDCVQQCQRLEHMAMESLLMLEEDRCVIVMHGWNKMLHTASSCNRRLSVSAVSSDTKSTTTEPTDPLVEALCGDKKSPKRAARRKHSLSGIIIDEEEGAGAMDAETLDLPMEIGQLRDQVQCVAMARLQTVHATRVLVSFLDSVATASTRFAQGLQQQKIKGLDSIRDALKTVDEFERVVTVWTSLTTSLAHQANAPHHLANELRKQLSHPSLEHIFLYGEKVLKPFTERDTATWKQLCDAARSQARAEARYREATAHKAKARDRCRSVDSVGASSSASLVNVAGKHMTQSIASIMSILPNGGEHAMKVLDPSMRVSLAHSNLEEADHKETKERQLLDSAMELTTLSLEAYKSSAETLLRHCEDTLDGYGALLASLMELWREFQSGQLQHSEEDSAASSVGIDSYLNSWLEQARDSLKNDNDTTGTELSRIEPFLAVLLEDSDVVQKALRSVQSQSEAVLDASDRMFDDDTEVDLMDDATEKMATTPLRERAASASSVVVPSKIPMDESATSWLLRSLTDTESIFGKLAMARKIPRVHQQDVGLVNTESNVFVRYFWPEELELKTPVHILDSFACSFRDGSQRFPFQYGRVFMTNEQIMFVAWTRKQLSLLWSSVVEVTPVQNRLSDQSELVVKCRKKGTAEESYMILSGFYDRPKVLTLIGRLREQKRQVVEAPTSAPTDNAMPIQTSRLSVTTPDVKIAKMTAVVSGRLQALSILSYYDAIWSERSDENVKPFYKPWLEKECFDVVVGPWQSGDFVGSWCGESYTQKREITFKVKRKTHLYIGPPIANIMQTHFCRLEGTDRCVVQIRVEIDGIPYGDTFAVEIRWVAARDGENDIQIDVGVEVDFKKSTFLKGKIRAGTIEETSLVHKDLFASIQSRCSTERGIDPLPPTAVEPIPKIDGEYTAKRFQSFDWMKGAAVGCGILILFALLRRFFSARVERTCPIIDESYPGTTTYELQSLGAKMDRLETEVERLREVLYEILSLVRKNQEET